MGKRKKIPEIGDWIGEKDLGTGGGQYTGETCPECGGRITFNGSYLCERWNYDVIRESADEKPDYVTTCDYGVASDVQFTYVDRVLMYRLTGAWHTETVRNGEFRYNTYHTYPGKTGYVRKKHREYLDNLGPVPEKKWHEIRDEREKEKGK